MTPAEHARQIDAQEFKRDSKRALDRALAYSQQKKDERRRAFLITIYGEEGRTMPLWSTLPKETEAQPVEPVPKPKIVRPREPVPKPKIVRPHEPARQITANGQTLTVQEWADHLQISMGTLFARLRKYGSLEAAVEQGGKQRRKTDKRITFDGQSLSMREWADHLGINYDAFYARVKKNGSDRAIKMGGPQKGGSRPRPANSNTLGVSSNLCPLRGPARGAPRKRAPK